MRYLLGFLCVCALVGTLPQSASGQAGEEGATSEPKLEEPAPASEPAPEEPAPAAEPAPEEPALELKLDDAGVGVVPSPWRTPDGYTLEEMERRVKRAKIGLGVSAGFYALGIAFVVGTIACDDPPPQESSNLFPTCGTALGVSGSVLTIGGLTGMIVSGVRLARRKRDRNWLRQAQYGRLHQIQWDLARSRLVF